MIKLIPVLFLFLAACSSQITPHEQILAETVCEDSKGLYKTSITKITYLRITCLNGEETVILR